MLKAEEPQKMIYNSAFRNPYLGEIMMEISTFLVDIIL